MRTKKKQNIRSRYGSKIKPKTNNKKLQKQRAGFIEMGPLKVKKNGDIKDVFLTINGIEWSPKMTTKFLRKKKTIKDNKRVIKYQDIQIKSQGRNILKIVDTSTNKTYTFSNDDCDGCIGNAYFYQFVTELRNNIEDTEIFKNRVEKANKARKMRKKRLREIELADRPLPPLPGEAPVARPRPGEAPVARPRPGEAPVPKPRPVASPRLGDESIVSIVPTEKEYDAYLKNPDPDIDKNIIGGIDDVIFGITDEEIDRIVEMSGAVVEPLTGGSKKRKSKRKSKRKTKRKTNKKRSLKKKYRNSFQLGGVFPCNPCRECSVVANKPRKTVKKMGVLGRLFGPDEDIKEFALTPQGLRYRTRQNETMIVQWKDIVTDAEQFERMIAHEENNSIIIPIVKDGKKKDLVLELCERENCSNRRTLMHFKKCLLLYKEKFLKIQQLQNYIDKFRKLIVSLEHLISKNPSNPEKLQKYERKKASVEKILLFFEEYIELQEDYTMATDEERPSMKLQIDRYQTQFEKIIRKYSSELRWIL